MTTNNSNVLLGVFVAIAAIGLIGTLSTQLVFAQETTPVQDLKDLITSITGIITTLVGLVGAIIVVYARLSKKLGWVMDEDIKKMLEIARELRNTDQWSKQLDERLTQVVDVIALTSEGEAAIKSKNLDIQKWKNELSPIESELVEIHKKLEELIKKK